MVFCIDEAAVAHHLRSKITSRCNGWEMVDANPHIVTVNICRPNVRYLLPHHGHPMRGEELIHSELERLAGVWDELAAASAR
jgi:hypothetical protein